MAGIEKLDLKSKNITEEQKAKLKELFPEVFTEDKIDFDKLRLTLGSEVDDGEERFGMTWPGKRDCFKVIQEASIGTLKPCRDESVNWDKTENLFIEGDNLEVLKLFQKSYYGKIKMIYIDPPYNRGKELIYPDKYSESLETYLAYTGQIDAEGRKFSTNPETDGRFHSKWLNMMYSRLFLSRNLLRKDGAILISIDDNEIDNLIRVCNEIFGEENYCGTITVINNLKGRNDKKNIATCHEYIVIYSKSDDFESYGMPLTEKQKEAFKYTDENGYKYDLRDLRKRGRPDRREDRPNMFFPIYYNRHEESFSLTRKSLDDIEITPKRGDGSDGRWRWGKKRVSKNINILHAKFTKKSNKWDIMHRVYLNQISTTMIDGDDDLDEDEENNSSERTSKSKSIWMGGELSTDVGRRSLKEIISELDYDDYPKPVEFIKRCLFFGSSENDIILDFFAGTGTTIQAALELSYDYKSKRRFICIQLPEVCGKNTNAYKSGFNNISEIAKERTRRVINKIQKEINKRDPISLPTPDVDLGFKVFKLDKSNFKIWDGNIAHKPIQEQLKLAIDHIDPNSKEEDILYEILLKSGFELTTPVEELTVEGKKVYSVAEGALLICLEKNLTKELIRAIAEKEPHRVVCLDSGFKGNDQLKTNAVQIMKSFKVESFRTV